MNNPFPAHDFRTHTQALEAASAALSIARQLPPPLRSIADQLIRSANSVPANLAHSAMRLFDRVRAMTWRLIHRQE